MIGKAMRMRYRVLCLREGNISSDAIAWRFSTKGVVITKGRDSRSFDVLQRSVGSLGRSFEFSSRRREACRPSCILPFLDSTCERSVRARVRACVRVNTPVSPGTLGVSPFGIRQGYRGCSGVLVVIGVGRTDHLNTRHCNHDRAPSLSLSF